MVMALAWNASNGTIEGLPVVGLTDTSFTIATRHFSSELMLQPAGPAASAPLAPGPAALPFSVGILAAAFPADAATAFAAFNAGASVNSGFDPAVDAWEFPNNGSYISPVGEITGTSLSELYYHWYSYSSASTPRLFGTYNLNFKAFWAGDNLGYRVASLAETDVDWPGTQAAIASVENLSLVGRLLNQRNVDQLNFFGLLAALAQTGRPQMLIADGPPASGGFVGLLVYQMNRTEVWAADPDHPGSTIKIPFVNGHFQPIQLGMMTGIPPFTATRFHFVAESAMINFARLKTNFLAMFQGGPVGASVFPAYTIQYFDEDLQLWTDLPGNHISIGWTDVKLRAFCPTCQRAIPGPTAGLAALDVYTQAGAQIATDRTTGSVTFKVPPGGETVGIHILGGVPACAGCQTVWRHLDFQVLGIQASAIYILPDPVFGTSSAPLKLTAKNLATLTPATWRYSWSFGDGNVAQVDGDSVVQHTWTKAGKYQVKVTVVDIATGNSMGKASVEVEIDQAVPIWQFTSLVRTISGQLSSTVQEDRTGVIHLYFSRDIEALMDGFYHRPDTGLLYFMGSGFTVGNQSFPAGVYVQRYLSTPGFDPTLGSYAVLAQPTKASYVDSFIDDLVVDAQYRRRGLGKRHIQRTFGDPLR